MHHHRNAPSFLLGFLVGTAATLLGGGYYLFGPEGGKHRDKAASWVKETRGKLLSRMRRAKNLTEETYTRIVDGVTREYVEAKELTQEQANALARRFKERSKEMLRAVEDSAREAREEMEEEEL